VLYVLFDDTGRCLVSRDDPAPARRAERADYDGVVAIVLGDQWEDGALAAPDLSGARLLTGSILVVVAGATLAAFAIVSPLLAMPLGAAAALLVGRRHNAAAAQLEQRWTGRHVLLETRVEVARFRKAFDAVRTIQVAWPFLAELVQIPSPRREVSASLWAVAGLLREHAELAELYAGLSDARFGTLPAEAPVRAALDDRMARVDTAQRKLRAEIDRRIESLTDLAARCASFVRAESALHAAHEAVRRADESLNRVSVAVPDDMRDLSERTEAIIAAYRELTG
jgi:hypothetical protein